MSVSLLDQWRLVQAITQDASLPDGAVRVAVAALSFQNRKSGLCNPSFESIAQAACLKRRATISAIQRLEAAGWIAVERRGGRHLTNSLTFAFDRLERVHGDAPFDDPETVHVDAPFEARKGALDDTKGCTGVHPNPKEEPLLSNERRRGGGADAPRAPARGGAGAPRGYRRQPKETASDIAFEMAQALREAGR